MIGDVIGKSHGQLGVSQERLGLDSGVHRNYIGGIERAERRLTVPTTAPLGGRPLS